MQTSAILHNLESALDSQLALAGADPNLEAAGRAILAALRPALKEAAFELAGQAAEEVRAQVSGHRVDLTVVDGEPTIRITPEEQQHVAPSVEEDFDARITLRLPPSIKEIVEQAASESGDSVNSWVVKALSRRISVSRPSNRRVNETFEI
jgi:HicB family